MWNIGGPFLHVNLIWGNLSNEIETAGVGVATKVLDIPIISL